MDYIITSLQLWDSEIGTTVKNTAIEIAKNHRVLYVNTPLDIRARFQKKDANAAPDHRFAVLRGKTSPIRRMTDTLWVLDCPFTLLPVGQLPSPLFEWANHYNNRRLGRWIKSQAAKLGFQSYIHLIDNDIYRSLYLKEYLRPGSQGGFHGRAECSVPGKMQEVFVPPNPGQGSQRGSHAGAGKGTSLPTSKVSL